MVGGQGSADADGVGGVLAADGLPALGHVAVQGPPQRVTQAGQAGELLIDVVRVHVPILKQRLLDNKLQRLYNKGMLLIQRAGMTTDNEELSCPPAQPL